MGGKKPVKKSFWLENDSFQNGSFQNDADKRDLIQKIPK